MSVQDTIDLGNGHWIEIGDASWDQSQTSVRNRYSNSNGALSSRSSSEIPLADLEPIVAAVAQCDLLDVGATNRLIGTLTASLARRAESPRLCLAKLLEGVTEENRHPEFESGLQ